MKFYRYNRDVVYAEQDYSIPKYLFTGVSIESGEYKKEIKLTDKTKVTKCYDGDKIYYFIGNSAVSMYNNDGGVQSLEADFDKEETTTLGQVLQNWMVCNL